MDNAGTAKEPTAMESMVKRVMGTTDAICSANHKLEPILTKLRGNRPTSPGEAPKDTKEPDKSHLGMLEYQMQLQTEALNYLHNQIDELSNLI